MPSTFPLHLFNPTSRKVSVVANTVQSPPSLSGVGQILRTDGGGYVYAQFTGILLRNPFLLRLAKAWEGELAAGVTRVNVPVASLGLAPRGMAGGVLQRPGSLLASTDDPYFPDANGYAAPLIVATISPAAFRATTVTINISKGSRLVSGQTFAINHPIMGWRIYTTKRVLSRNGQSATVTINLPLREAITSTTPVNFDWPMFQGVLVPDTDISQDISYNHAQVSYSFREAF